MQQDLAPLEQTGLSVLSISLLLGVCQAARGTRKSKQFGTFAEHLHVKE